ncbi:type II toxin-antitoxin system RatA family toxin [Candidatus Methylopumilus turicensis]|uniref:Cyclase/dehydrase n=1 Tax=Candidatus Methylopumilus turicensis TaxID=1581680 RepID=A0A0B7ITX5_9PROT|nr:type II toxin-antitoxin system RatA family toxin [Candidatus Methylopumilus turicensis]CEN55740.1 Cyclase/dehydrase [Candidatus Methylopumilus turicensis]
MVKVEKTVLVHHSAAQMFNLVDDVEHYTEFLPWCGGVDLIERTDAITSATIYIDFHGLKQQFTTKNQKRFPYAMDMQFKDGPFKHFEGNWRFTALSDQACKIEFHLEYEFSSAFLSQIISPVFSHIANTFVDSFVMRADNTLNQ